MNVQFQHILITLTEFQFGTLNFHYTRHDPKLMKIIATRDRLFREEVSFAKLFTVIFPVSITFLLISPMGEREWEGESGELISFCVACSRTVKTRIVSDNNFTELEVYVNLCGKQEERNKS
ncbi:hypothetical protein CEXT_332731 [Caerostris extrusa]|uniref:Uncharacterized protein n=1 Tax=Caerostris extrusa TaxID=172846 RepID=A0AAV4X1F8_CAEEX|nr:hypothetical protein CEXT_332731 [Caerostris extrusa]